MSVINRLTPATRSQSVTLGRQYGRYYRNRSYPHSDRGRRGSAPLEQSVWLVLQINPRVRRV